jgi:hypothetical protein
MSNHNEFILKPITNILEDVVSASAGVGNGIETYPLCDYIMQSVFLKMTGFQEQKMKCICWELATNDYEYRYKRFSQKPLGECSNYDEKKIVYQDLIKQIEKYTPNFNVVTDIDKKEIRKSTTLSIERIFSKTNLLIWGQKIFNEYKSIWENIEEKHFANENNNLFTEINNGISLKEIYENHLYKHRNRVAHNTQSYQQNLPTLKTLASEKYIFDNYFVWFAILVLIDKIFIELYEKYLNVKDD